MSSPPPAANEPTQRVPFPAFPFVNTPGQTDIILRTSDGVDFYVRLAILSLVSPVFETMFTLPQAENSSQIYPVIDLTVDSLDELKEVIEILISKYDMQWLVPSVKKHLERYVTSDPITVYAYAYVHGWEDLGRAAAKETLKLPLRTPGENTPEALRLIPADAYHTLLRYHYCCGVAARTTTVDLGWISWPDSSTAEYRWFHCWRDSCAVYNSRGPIIVANGTRAARQWFMDYFVGMGDILAITPAVDVRDPAHPLFVRMIDRANECEVCRDRVSNHLRHFTALWVARIQTVIQEVEWKF
ncbi:BTB domain-containing protein [Mycena sanguinolenta]|uniref:BTB domain-containing protein n=1 Tax=Mycena sanguinolenta TaxID=230812 RepID=A0A8H6ZG61_9AGAR|nr:BTB domain-containing protein [Mycena sanguinolenta]